MKRKNGNRWERKRSHQISNAYISDRSSKYTKKLDSSKRRLKVKIQLNKVSYEDDWDLIDYEPWLINNRSIAANYKTSCNKEVNPSCPVLKPGEILKLPNWLKVSWKRNEEDKGSTYYYRAKTRVPHWDKTLQVLKKIYHTNDFDWMLSHFYRLKWDRFNRKYVKHQIKKPSFNDLTSWWDSIPESYEFLLKPGDISKVRVVKLLGELNFYCWTRNRDLASPPWKQKNIGV